jgi:uncharacterized protein (TIGR02594 family)
MTEILLESLKYYGTKEITGDSDNELIVQMLKDIDPNVRHDEVSWCSAYMNYLCKKLGYMHTNSLMARSWFSMPIEVLKPSLGDIVILWRNSPKSWEGHVGLYISEDKDNIFVLGGNQSDQVNISPYLKTRVLGYRQTKKEEEFNKDYKELPPIKVNIFSLWKAWRAIRKFIHQQHINAGKLFKTK